MDRSWLNRVCSLAVSALLFVFALFGSQVANAVTVSPVFLVNGSPLYSSTSAASACQAFAAEMAEGCKTMAVTNIGECSATCTTGYIGYWPIVKKCPDGSTMDAQGLCQKDAPSQSELCATKTGNLSTFGSTAVTACLAGCMYDNGVSVSASGKITYSWVPRLVACDGTQETTSDTLPSAESSASSAADSACPSGQCRASGTINGVTINKCVSCNVVQTTSDKTTSSSASSTSSGVTSSKDGTVTGTETTKCVGSTCTTTTSVTTTSSDGTASTSTTTSTESKDSFCKSNPKSAACVTSSWSGSCAAGFSCDGDAVSCAIARENHVRNCTLFEQETTLSTLGRNSANDQAQPSGHPGANPSVVNVSGSIDQTNPFGSSCPADFSLDAMGVAVNVPLSSACGILQMLGYIAVAFAMYSAARITLGGLTS